MTLNQHHPPTRGNSASLQPPGLTGNELNLYDDLLTFSELPTEERLREPAPPHEQPLTAIEPEDGAGLQSEARTLEDSEAASTAEVTDGAADSPSLPAESAGQLGDAEFAFKGALSEGICLNCGAESGAENLFCAACAAFDEEVGALSPSDPACTECGGLISTADVFCSECGALLTSS